MKKKYYIIHPKTSLYHDGKEVLIPNIDGVHVKNKEKFFDIGNYSNQEFEKNWVFDYLIPRYSDEDEQVEFICDFHYWIGEKPFVFIGYPISKKMKNILEKFNLYPNKFYEAKVLFENAYHDYFVWQHFMDGFDKYVDFEKSTFCERKLGGEYGKDIISVNNENQLRKFKREKKWHEWAFKNAVMIPEFKNIDCMALPYPYRTLISEGLKAALEEADITGIEIKPFHVELEF